VYCGGVNDTSATVRTSVSVRDRWVAMGILAGIVIGLVFLGFRHPVGTVPSCPTWRFGGVYCPGCGSLRATHALLNGALGEALRHNVMLVLLGVPLGAWYIGGLVMTVVVGRRPRAVFRNAWIGWAALMLLLVFTLLRNLPGETFGTLRPPDPHVHE